MALVAGVGAARAQTAPPVDQRRESAGAGVSVGSQAAADAEGGAARADGTPPTQPYARAAAFAAYDVTRQRELARSDGGALVSAVTEDQRASAGVLGEVGVERRGERTSGRLEYLLGIQVAEGASTGLDDVTQGLDATLDRRLGERTTFTLRLAGFWGVRDSESVVDGVGLGAPEDPQNPSPAGTAQRRITRVPYLRLDAGTGLAFAPDARLTNRFELGAGAVLYPDHDVVHASGERLFETWTLGPENALEYRLTENDTLSGTVDARTTWYAPVYAVRVEAGERPAAETLDPIETLGARLGWRRVLTPRWSVSGTGGIGAVIPLGSDNPDAGSSMSLLGGAATAWGAGPWRLEAQAERGIAQSEVGAVFATTSARIAGQRAWASGVLARLGGGLARYDVLTQVFASAADLEDFAAAPEGATLSRAELASRARRAQEGYGLQGNADLNWQFWGFAGMSIAYVVERRMSDDRDRGDRLVHRGILGLTLTTREGAPVDLEPLEGE